MTRTLILRKQSLAELTPAELDAVGGAAAAHTASVCVSHVYNLRDAVAKIVVQQLSDPQTRCFCTG